MVELLREADAEGVLLLLLLTLPVEDAVCVVERDWEGEGDWVALTQAEAEAQEVRELLALVLLDPLALRLLREELVALDETEAVPHWDRLPLWLDEGENEPEEEELGVAMGL